MSKTRYRLMGICAAATILWQAPVFADCPDTALQSTVDNFIAVSQPGADVSAILEAVDTLIEACPTDPHVLKLAAMTYANSPSPDAAASVGRLTTSLNLISRMWDNLDGNPTRYVTNQNGKRQLIGFLDLYEIEKQILNGLLQAEQISGVQSTITYPPAGSDAGTGCKTMDSTMVSLAATWIQYRGEHPGAYSLMDHLIAKCDADLADPRYTRMLGRRAQALLASIQRDPQQEGGLEKAAQAKADSERFLELFGGYDNVGWLKSKDQDLERAIAAVRAANQPFVLSEALFVSPRLEDPATQRALALMFDEAWAKDAEAGLAGGYTLYRRAVMDAYLLTQKADDPARARAMLHKAVEEHATGKVRAPGNETLEPPPGYLYNWLKPGEPE